MTRRLFVGALVVAAYVAVALVTTHGVPIARPLYDGLAPAAPYRFVSPPPELKADNEQPEPGNGIVDLVDGNSAPTSISTGDGQMQVVFQKGTFTGPKNENAIAVSIDPIAPPPPAAIGGGLKITGNGYTITAAYSKSHKIATPKREMTVVLRYPTLATAVVRREGSRWVRLKAQISQASLQLFAQTRKLGTYAAAGKPHSNFWKYVPYAAGVLGIIAGIVGYFSGRRGWFRKRGERRRKGKPGKRATPRPGRRV